MRWISRGGVSGWRASICFAVMGLGMYGCIVQPVTPPIPTRVLPTPVVVTETRSLAMATEELIPTAVASGCEHLLWPLREGASWRYRLSTLTEVKEVTLDTAIEGGATLRLDGHSSVLNCMDGALSGLPPGIVGHPDLGNGIVASNPRGSYLPAAAQLLPLGTPATWDLELDAGGVIRLPFIGGEAVIEGGKLVLFHEVRGLESVTVPVGEFTALVVHQDVFLQIQIGQGEGLPTEAIISLGVVWYYVEGVGPVKAIYEGGVISTSDGAWTLEVGPVLELVALP